MKLLLENFQSFVNEQEQTLPQIYCDMDGVLVDFEQGVVDQVNKDLKMIRKMADKKNLTKIQSVLDRLGRDEVSIKYFRGAASEAEKFEGSLRKYMYGRVSDDPTFWANLPWMPGGKELWAFIAPYKPHILTSPMAKGSEYGKTMWIHENLGKLSREQKVHMSHKKYKWAVNEDGSSNVLIDDWSKNTVPWANADGIAIQHVNGNTTATIAKLKELGFS
jgi:5'(3')-deoxyribonucleotidase